MVYLRWIGLNNQSKFDCGMLVSWQFAVWITFHRSLKPVTVCWKPIRLSFTALLPPCTLRNASFPEITQRISFFMFNFKDLHRLPIKHHKVDKTRPSSYQVLSKHSWNAVKDGFSSRRTTTDSHITPIWMAFYLASVTFTLKWSILICMALFLVTISFRKGQSSYNCHSIGRPLPIPLEARFGRFILTSVFKDLIILYWIRTNLFSPLFLGMSESLAATLLR